MMGVGGVWFVLLLAGVVVLAGVAAAVALAADRGRRDQGSGRAHDVLRERLAAGEIDPDEYRERAELIGPARGAGPSVGRWLPVALVMLAVLVLLGLLAPGFGRAGPGWWAPRGGPMDGMMGQGTTQGSAPDPIPDAKQVTIEAGDLWFDPDTIQLDADEPVNLTVTNVGEVFHGLTIDELDLQLDVDSGQSASAGVEIDEPGGYEYYCSVPGHAEAGMRGTLVATAP